MSEELNDPTERLIRLVVPMVANAVVDWVNDTPEDRVRHAAHLTNVLRSDIHRLFGAELERLRGIEKAARTYVRMDALGSQRPYDKAFGDLARAIDSLDAKGGE